MTAATFRPLLASEAKLFGRSAGSVLWTALAPIAALIALGSIPAVKHASKDLHGISYLDAYLPILMMFSLCMSSVNLLPPTLALYRERGILRRLSTTPVPPARLLAAQATIYFGVALIVSVVLLVLAVAAYGVTLPHQLPGFALSLLLVAAATTGLGLLVAGLAPSAKAANAIAMGLFFPLMFLAGLWVPRATMPTVMRTISDYSPLGAGVRCVQSSIAGHWPPAQGLLVLLAYAVVLCAVAVRTFRWE
jgi:ABC-2 type transport system permease protein